MRKKKSILDINFTDFYLGFLFMCSIGITFGAYNKEEDIVAISFSFIAGVLITLIASRDRKV